MNQQPDDVIQFEDHERARRLAGMTPTDAAPAAPAGTAELTLIPPGAGQRSQPAPPPAPQPWYARAWPWALVFLLALALRFAYLQQIRTVPFFDTPVGDAAAYDAWARRIAAGDWLGSETFYQAPAYPYFLAIIYRFVDDGPVAIRSVQAVMGALACLLVALATARFFGKIWVGPPADDGAGRAPGFRPGRDRVDQPVQLRPPRRCLIPARTMGITAGILLAVYPPAIFFGGLIQKTALAMLWMSLALYVAGRLLDRPRLGGFFLLGVVIAFFGLTRENALVLAGVVLLWILLGFRGAGWHNRQVWIAGLVAGLLVVFYPVTLRNWFVGGVWAPTTVQAGPNFYIGNNPEATGLYIPLVPNHETPEFERADARRLAEEALGRRLTDIEVSHYWLGRATDFIRAEPQRWFGLFGKKLALAVNRYEISDTEGYNVYCGFAWMLGALAPLVNFGTLGPLAAAGFVLTLANWRRLRLLYLAGLALLLAIAAFYIFARYRFPLVPLVAMFAAAGIIAIANCLRERRGAPLLAAGLVVAVAGALCNWPLVNSARLDAMAFSNVGTVLAQRGDIDAAVTFFKVAIDKSPESPEPYYQLGLASILQGDSPQAIDALMEAKQRAPAWADIDYQLGAAFEQDGNAAAASQFYTQALRGTPDVAAAARDALQRLQSP